MRELNKLFDVKSREDRRKTLDKFDISAEDKNKVLNKLSSNDKYAPRYFKIDWEKADEDWKYCLFEIPGQNDSKLSSSTKIIAGTPIISAYNIVNIEHYQQIVAFSYNICKTNNMIISFEIAIDIVNNILVSSGGSPVSMNGITEITAEEYYT